MRSVSVLLLVLLALVPGIAQGQFPRGVIAEDATATWCTYCPYAYQGLEVMKSTYDATEFNAVRYYATSGGLGSAETDARISYYGVTGYPTVVFDGLLRVVGGSTEIATGSAYDPIVRQDIAAPSPFRIRINSVDLVQPSGSIDLDVIVEETVADIGNMQIRAIILENNVLYSTTTHQDVTRDVLPDHALSVSQAGQIQNVVMNFAIDPSWKTSDLWMVILIQDDDDRSIPQSVSTRPQPAYSLRYWAKGQRVAVRPSNSAAHEFADFAVYNLGTNADVIRVTLDPGTLPSGWTCEFTDGTDTWNSFADFSLSPAEGKILRLRVTPGTSGYAAPKFTFTSTNLPGVTRELPYSVITDDVQVLLVDDDGAQTYETMHAAALQAAGRTFGIWPTGVAQVTAADLAWFPIVSWHTALSYPTLGAADRAALGAYLDAGGRLFLSGQEIGWELNDEGGAAYQWYQNYLHANFVNDDANQNTVNGIAGDPISDGMSLALTPAMNPYPDVISPRDGAATPTFNYGSGTQRAGLKVDTGAYRLVYLGFGFETITTQANRDLLTQRVLNWLGDAAAVPGAPEAGARLEISAWPNPAPGAVDLRFRLPISGRAAVAVFAPDGSLVRMLSNGVRSAGPHTLRWDGRDIRGREVPAGVYFYRLEAGEAASAGKIVLTRP